MFSEVVLDSFFNEWNIQEVVSVWNEFCDLKCLEKSKLAMFDDIADEFFDGCWKTATLEVGYDLEEAPDDAYYTRDPYIEEKWVQPADVEETIRKCLKKARMVSRFAWWLLKNYDNGFTEEDEM